MGPMNRRRDERGFSLIELMIALVVTLVVTGSIYAFIAQGQNAFRREPEVADRQQNIRLAMDLIMRDIMNAGAGMPPFIQAFTSGLNANSDQGAPTGLDNEVTDELEILTNTGARDNEPVCDEPGSSAQVRFVRRLPPPPDPQALPVPQLVIIVMADGTWTVRNAVSTADDSGGSGNCTGGTEHTRLNFNTGQDTTNPKVNVQGCLCNESGWGIGSVTGTPPGACTAPCNPLYVGFSQVVRYRIREDVNGEPVLQRFSSADFQQCAGSIQSGGTWDDGCFQTIARGVEDLQVTYTQANGTPSDDAPPVVTGDYNSLITRVQVTLSARTQLGRLVGETTNASAPTRLRGRLVSSESPRAALIHVSQEPGVGVNSKWR
jgi:prepilin-type N-terminal cleavage/methylation domain-containing protein